MGKPVSIYLIRHGQTYTNLRELLIGGGGSAPLTALGRTEAKMLGLALADTHFDAVYSSPLARTLETTRCILGNRPIDITSAEGLRDISWGTLEGSPPEALHSMLGYKPQTLAEVFGLPDDAEHITPFAGESMYVFLNRFGAEIDKIRKNHSDTGGRVMAVCHSSLAFFLGRHMQNPPDIVGNTSITEILWQDGDIQVVRAGDLAPIQHGRKLYAERQPLRLTLFGDVETLFRSKGLLEGQCDSKLTEKGISQAKQIATRYDGTFSAAYCSPLNRAKALASIVMQDNSISFCDGLTEVFFANLECESIELIKRQNPDYIDLSKYSGTASQMLTALRSIAEKHWHNGGDVAVFSHDIAIRSVLDQLNIPVPSREVLVVTLEYKDEAFFSV